MKQNSDFRYFTSAVVPELKLLKAAMSDFHYDRHFHDEYCFGVTLTGRQDFFSGGAYHRSSPGNVICFRPGEVHDGQSGGEVPLNYVMLYIAAGQVEPLLAEAAGVVEAPVSLAPGTQMQDPVMRDSVLALARLMQLGVGSRIDHEYALYRIAARARQLEGRFEPGSVVRRVDRLLYRARDYIHAHTDSDLSLDEISRAAHLSKYHFLRMFRRQFGLTPHQYVLSCRLNAARRELDAGGDLQGVIQRYGFCDLSHFNRRFKRIYGMTPRQYQLGIRGRGNR